MSILTDLLVALFKFFLNRWLVGREKPPEQKELEHALDAKDKEAEALAAPARDKSAIVDSMRSRIEH